MQSRKGGLGRRLSTQSEGEGDFEAQFACTTNGKSDHELLKFIIREIAAGAVPRQVGETRPDAVSEEVGGKDNPRSKR